MEKKTYYSKQFRGFDRMAVKDFGIPSIILMENAGIRISDFIRDKFRLKVYRNIVVVCGCGSNGGDGFVVARHMHNSGYLVSVIVLAHKREIKLDAEVNLKIIKKMGIDLCFSGAYFQEKAFLRKLKHSSLVVDAIFGIGLNRAVDDPLKSYINCINDSDKPVVAIDIPSGICADTGRVLGAAVKSDHTVTMSAVKKGFFINDGPNYTGLVHVVDIGIGNFDKLINRKC